MSAPTRPQRPPRRPARPLRPLPVPPATPTPTDVITAAALPVLSTPPHTALAPSAVAGLASGLAALAAALSSAPPPFAAVPDIAAPLLQLLADAHLAPHAELQHGVVTALLLLVETEDAAAHIIADAGVLPVLAILVDQCHPLVERPARQLCTLVESRLDADAAPRAGVWNHLLADAHVLELTFRSMSFADAAAHDPLPDAVEAEVETPHLFPAFVAAAAAATPLAAPHLPWTFLPGGFILHNATCRLVAADTDWSSSDSESESEAGAASGVSSGSGSSEALDDAINREARASVYGLELLLSGADGAGGLDSMLSQMAEADEAVSATTADAANVGRVDGSSGLFGSFLRNMIDGSVSLSDLEVVVDHLVQASGPRARAAAAPVDRPASVASSSLALLRLRFGPRPYSLTTFEPGERLVLRLLVPFVLKRAHAADVLAPLLGESDRAPTPPPPSSPRAPASWRPVAAGAAVVLARFLYNNSSLVLNRRVVELGSACALVALVAAHCQPAAVLATSVPGPPAEWVDVNLYLGAPHDELVASLPLAWSAAGWAATAASFSSPAALAAFDLAVGADLVSVPSDGPSVAAALATLLAPAGLAVLAHNATRAPVDALHAALAATPALAHTVLPVPAWLCAAVEFEDEPHVLTLVWRAPQAAPPHAGRAGPSSARR